LLLVAFGLEFSFVAANCVTAAVSTLICAAISASTCVNRLLGLICATISAIARVNGLLWTFLKAVVSACLVVEGMVVAVTLDGWAA
jgi:hypothetical protein